ncbi:MAG: M1 family metallopeptidase [Clostridia bacterium]|nr:M1 family metallopeptidase [Clostridia bacterium]
MKKFIALFFLISGFALFPLCGCAGKKQSRTLYVIRAAFNGENTVTASMEVDYFNDTETEIKYLCFNLFANAYREGAEHFPCSPADFARAYPNGLNYGGIVIESCSESGEESDWEIVGDDLNILVLRLKKGVFPSERAKVEIVFTVTVPDCRLRMGVTGGPVNLGNWFPVLCARYEGGFYECTYYPLGDPFFSETADYKVSFEVPGSYTVASSGRCVSTEIGENTTVYYYELYGARDFAAVLCPDFCVEKTSACGVEISLYHVNCAFSSEILTAAAKALELFSELFGKYPYETFSVAVTEFIQGGMEYPSLVYVSSFLEKEEAVAAAVHETAHQWWYAAVGNNQAETAYLDEGLAEYSTLLFYENYPAYGLTREGIVKEKTSEFRAFYGVFEQITGTVNAIMERNLAEFNGEPEYVEICYVRSALMFDGLRESIGDKKFFAGLKTFYSENEFGVAGTDELISSFVRGGFDVESYIRSWLTGRAII